MSDPFVAEIKLFGFSFAPRGFALCNGQLMPISQNTALFSLLGITYGGDGKVTFALPNLQGSAAMSQGQGSGVSQRYLGEQVGEPYVTLLQTEMPMHTHALQAGTANATQTGAAGAQLAKGFKGSLQSSNSAKMYSTGTPQQPLSPQSISVAGGSQPHNNMMPYLTMNYCIALQGVFPQRP